MKRQRYNTNAKLTRKELLTRLEYLKTRVTRSELSRRMGYQYDDYRKIYKALGYPDPEGGNQQMVFSYYWNKYERQDIARAIIDRPVDATWNGTLKILEPDTAEPDSTLAEAWGQLEDVVRIKKHLNEFDKLAGIGHYAVLLLGFDDVKQPADWQQPLGGNSRKLLYAKAISEDVCTIEEYETATNNPNYGRPRVFKISLESVGEESTSKDIMVHHSRCLYLEATPRLKPIANRLEDLDKILGGSAEIFWRGARPGYFVKPNEDAAFSDTEITQLEDELDKYEHDFRRVLTAEGIDEVRALQQQLADPAAYLDAQLQAISAQTGIPKRILVGSERGELSSSQDRDQWLGLIKTRKEEYAEPDILRPLVNKLMEVGVLPREDSYNVMWEDLFAPSAEEKAKVGEIRARALKAYGDSMSQDIMPVEQFLKYVLGLTDEEIEEVTQAAEEQAAEEDRAMRQMEGELERRVQDEVNRRMTAPASGNGNGSQTQIEQT